MLLFVVLKFFSVIFFFSLFLEICQGLIFDLLFFPLTVTRVYQTDYNNTVTKKQGILNFFKNIQKS